MSIPSIKGSEKSFPFLELPKEMQGKVLSFCGTKDLQRCTVVSRKLRNVTIWETNGSLNNELLIFIKNVIERLNPDVNAEQIALLQQMEALFQKDFPNLKAVLEFFLSKKIEIFNVLVSLNEDVLNSFENIVPLNFKDDFQIAKISVKFPDLNIPQVMNTKNKDRSNAFYEIAKKLIIRGNISEAIYIIKIIKDEFCLGKLLTKFPMHLLHLNTWLN